MARPCVVPLAACATLLAACQTSPDRPRRVPPWTDQGPRPAPFDVEHHALELDLDPRARTIEARATIRLWSKDVALSRVQLDFTDLRVRDVRDGDGRELAFVHANGVLDIALEKPLPARAPLELRVDYAGSPRRGLYFADVEDGAATQVFTHGECEDARGWFPCWDTPEERATSELCVRMPANWIATAAGERVERRELDDGRVQERWTMSTPHPAYLTTLVAGDFVVQRQEWDGIPLVHLADPTLAHHLPTRVAATPDVLAYFSELTGVRYPYAKYSQAMVAQFPFGGMENISATTLTDAWLTDERGGRDDPPEGLIAHEAAHQWFGDLVTCSDWSHIWLNEGWATYATELFTEASLGREAFESSMAALRERYLDADVPGALRPVVQSRCREPLDLFLTGHVYPGGASRLHQLRFELGDKAFFAGVREYFARHRGTAVDTDDFRRAMEHASGRDLAAFFARWWNSLGHPTLRVRWSHDPDARILELTVEQTQDTAGGVADVFEMPLEVEIAPGDGSPPRVERVQLDRRRARFEFELAHRPRWVSADPRGWLAARVGHVKGADEWLAIAADSAHPVARREACLALGGAAAERREPRRSRAFADALIARLAEDRAPTVRAAAARALRALAPAHGSAALQRTASFDPSAAVRVAALESLVGFAPDPALADFARTRFDDGFSYATMAAAVRLEVAAAPARAVERLAQALQLRTTHDALAARVVAGMTIEEIRSLNAELKAAAFDPARGVALREASVRALCRGGNSTADTRIAIEKLLDDPDFRLRRAAIESLGSLRDQRVLDALDRAYPRLIDPRERRAVEALWREPWAMR